MAAAARCPAMLLQWTHLRRQRYEATTLITNITLSISKISIPSVSKVKAATPKSRWTLILAKGLVPMILVFSLDV